jgi:hypothetical protein
MKQVHVVRRRLTPNELPPGPRYRLSSMIAITDHKDVSIR